MAYDDLEFDDAPVETVSIDALWEDDTGDMSAEERDALCALVTRPFVTELDQSKTGNGKKQTRNLFDIIADEDAKWHRIRRDLDNLGRELVIHHDLKVAYARQRPEVDEHNIRRSARQLTIREDDGRGLISADILYLALKLRNHLDEVSSHTSERVTVSEQELFQWFQNAPSAKQRKGDADAIRRAFVRATDACKNTGRGVGLIQKETSQPFYTVLPTVRLLVTDEFANSVIAAKEDAGASPESEATDE